MRPSSSLVTTASSNSSVEYIQRLENEIIELKEARNRDQEERVRDQEVRAKQEEVQKNILNFLKRITGPVPIDMTCMLMPFEVQVVCSIFSIDLSTL
ncbi:hypothetical protein SO802_033242 [Lithocarpus litseifolius]|uniref:Uncharacterized protein n=1 Tax=Lithocarpus litseifolius TaxID=425828 RepID=A0AAW2BEG5_9ROSI